LRVVLKIMDKKTIFTQIYNDQIDKIYRFIFLKVNSEEIAQDLTSETFLRGWEMFRGPDDLSNPNIKNPQALLYQIARNLVIDHYREKGRVQVVSIDKVLIPDPQDNPEQTSLIGSDLDEVKKAISSLKEEYQDVIILRHLDNRSFLEISELLGKSEEAVRTMLSRALKCLKKEMKIEEA